MAERRLRACVEAWPGCETGEYNPSCCRFPKSCSCTVYDPDLVRPEDLEPVRVVVASAMKLDDCPECGSYVWWTEERDRPGAWHMSGDHHSWHSELDQQFRSQRRLDNILVAFIMVTLGISALACFLALVHGR